ncbi:MAG: helix-turn-helix domain-containing protein [Spirochaetaceae bacterium]|jgi:transcriptional regulator with XRE-family HTH domain|nr:helix-turn-helix domain-containing protein [Spirochaetaceae bacterium]
MADEYIRSVLSDNLRKLRNRREWSQMELAEKANISMNFLSEIERGLKWPYPETLQNLAGALGVEVFELFKPKSDENAPGTEEYMNRFSNDVLIAVQESVKKSLANVKRQYGAAGNSKFKNRQGPPPQ